MLQNLKNKKHILSHEIVNVTPLMAQSWLDESHFNNRRLETSRVNKIAHDIKNDKWVFDGTPIRFNGGGDILDGQHRLYAIIKANRAVQSLVIRGLETTSKNTIDTGKSRSIGDILHFYGHVNTVVLAATARLSIAYDNYNGDLGTWSKNYARNGINAQDVLSKIQDNESLIRSVQAIISLKYTKQIAGSSVPAFCYYLFTNISSQSTADNFFQSLEHGNDLSSDSPILLLRNTLALRDSKTWLSGVKSATYKSALFIKAWNAWRKKEVIRFLKFSHDEAFPKAFK